jgi:hypothetical protein
MNIIGHLVIKNHPQNFNLFVAILMPSISILGGLQHLFGLSLRQFLIFKATPLLFWCFSSRDLILFLNFCAFS